MNPADKDVIIANAGKMSPAEIANRIHRTTELVETFIKNNVKPASTPEKAEEVERFTIRAELRSSEAWRNLKEEFTAEELKYFEESYVKLMTQFKSNVLPSEETQIFQAIKFEILMSRNLKERRKAREDIDRLDKMLADHLRPFGGDPSLMDDGQKEYALNLETQLNAARQAEQSRTNEYVKLQERHEALMKALKAVRDQRIKQIEGADISFLGVIKKLQERDVQEREGRQLELTKLAGQTEYERLGRPHKYEDGNEDSPILSCETVDLGPEEADEE